MVRTPLSNKSNEQVVRRRPDATKRPAKSSVTSLRSSCLFSSDPPPGCQFLTTIDCKYYGSSVLHFDVQQPFVQDQCMQIVQQVLAKNRKNSTPTVLGITDKGLQAENKGNGDAILNLTTDQLFKIVPGKLKSKNGKTFTVVIVVQFDPNSPRSDQYASRGAFDQPCHVFQCAHRADAAYMHEAAKRMWRDHMFHNLLDVSTEEAQEEFTSFTIQQDIETAYAKCTNLISQDIEHVEKKKRRVSSMLESDLPGCELEIGPRWV
eukprot:m.260296 g.260296  ORF g.260296 m.260296 type:complete len:263 (+) comp39639_c0_seq1:515-1303(+)